jgi:NAD(P)-dependent dehydrogenase (short-subunit alcohol dehydrogenase family)
MAEPGQRCVVLTGAAGGMGVKMTLALAGAGMMVVAVDRDAAALERLCASAAADGVTDRVRPWQADLAQRTRCEALVPDIVAACGVLHGLVNLAGVGATMFHGDDATRPVRFWEAGMDAWEGLVDINLRAPWILAAAAVRHMLARGSGRIVNVTTSFDTMLQPGLVAYGPSKAALEAATSCWARELEGSGVTVNALAPGGPVDTALIPPDSPMPRDQMIRPEVMGPPIVWLMSDAAKDVTNKRVVARLWGTEQAIAPAAWPGFGVQAKRPGTVSSL